MSDGYWAFGTQLMVGDGGSPEAFSAVAEVLDITGPGSTRDETEMTNHSSSGGWEDFIMTLKRGGMLTFSLNYIPGDASQNSVTGLESLFNSGRRTNFRLDLPDDGNHQVPFTGYVKSTGPLHSPVNGPGRKDYQIRVVGEVDWP